MNKKCVAANPTQTSTHSPMTITYRGCIDKRTPLKIRIPFFYEGHKAVHHSFQTFMIVFSICVLGNLSTSFHNTVGLIRDKKRDDATGPFYKKPRGTAHLNVTLHILHVGIVAPCQPLIKWILTLRQPFGFGDTTCRKAQLHGNRFDYSSLNHCNATSVCYSSLFFLLPE